MVSPSTSTTCDESSKRQERRRNSLLAESRTSMLWLMLLLCATLPISNAFTPLQSPRTNLKPLYNIPRPDEKESIKIGTSVSTESVTSRFQETIIRPLQGSIDSASDGWALSYADLSPDTEQTAAGQAFLATNIAYAIAGLFIVFIVQDYWLGLCTEACAFASFNYHYNQLLVNGQEKEDSVRLALLVDYVFAGASILTGFAYLFFTVPTAIPVEALLATGLGVAFLGASWKWEYGRPYMFLHGMWHLLSAAGGYLIADAYSIATSGSADLL